jgi:hypothetical protein
MDYFAGLDISMDEDKSLGGRPSADDNPRRWPVDRPSLCGRDRRSFAHPPIPRRRRLSGSGSQAASVGRGRLRRQHLEVRRQARANPVYEAANVMLTRYKGQLKLKDWAFAIAKRSTMRKARVALARRLSDHHPCDAARQDRVRSGLSPAIHETGGRIQLPRGATPEGGSRRRRGFCSTGSTYDRLRFQPSRAAPSLLHQVPNEHAENAGIPRRRHPEELPPLTH